MDTELWFTERQTSNLALSLKVNRTLYRQQSAYQEIAVLDTLEYGRTITLDGMVQATVFDEFVYHEMIVHVPMRTHPRPKNVLVIGGGDGGTVREICKYPGVEKVTLVEIDGEVIKAAQAFFPELSISLEDSRLEIKIEDGISYINSLNQCYDIIIIDSTEPMGAAAGLFDTPFYKAVYTALKEDGIMVAQTESPFVNKDLIRQVFNKLDNFFPLCQLYLASIPSYPSGLWSFTMGSKQYHPLEPEGSYIPGNLKYYTPEVHLSSFVLPPFVQELLKSEGTG